MGAATRHRRAFLAKHPYCAFCGGHATATTVEHCPPRALFQDRRWPESFEFPCCDQCNQSTSNDDLLIAMLARIDPFTESGDKDGKTNGLMQAVNQQFPEIFQKMMPSTRESRQRNRELGIAPKRGQTHQETGILNVPAEFHIAVCTFSRKLAKAIYYLDSTYIFPEDGCLLLHWFSNELLVTKGEYPQLELLKDLGGHAPALSRSGKFLNDQFAYKLTTTPEKNIFIIQAVFGKSFGLVVVGSKQPGVLEAMTQRFRNEGLGAGPFAVLQSSVLMIADDFGFATSKRTKVGADRS